MATRNILALDGGGMYGVVSLEACIAIEARLNRPLRDIFDLFVGTSTGAIITALAVMPTTNPPIRNLSAQEIMEIYLTLGDDIFSEEEKTEPILIPGVGQFYSKPRYPKAALENVLRRYIGGSTRTLSDVFNRFLGNKSIAITAYNMSRNTSRIFRSWEAVDGAIPLLDAVVASSVAPTQQAMHPIGGNCYVDGGIFASNPGSCALEEGLRLCEQGIWSDNDDFVIVSLGTGIKEIDRTCDLATQNRGDLWWAGQVAGIFLDGQDESTNLIMNQLARKEDWLQYFRFNPNLIAIPEKRGDETNIARLNQARNISRANLEGNQEFNRAIEALRRGLS